jgi:hypothetical protein
MVRENQIIFGLGLESNLFILQSINLTGSPELTDRPFQRLPGCAGTWFGHVTSVMRIPRLKVKTPTAFVKQ